MKDVCVGIVLAKNKLELNEKSNMKKLSVELDPTFENGLIYIPDLKNISLENLKNKEESIHREVLDRKI